MQKGAAEDKSREGREDGFSTSEYCLGVSLGMGWAVDGVE
jgi:hypothetical protein